MKRKLSNRAACEWTFDFTGSAGTDLTPRIPETGTIGEAIRADAWDTKGGRRPHVFSRGRRVFLSRRTKRPYAYVHDASYASY